MRVESPSVARVPVRASNVLTVLSALVAGIPVVLLWPVLLESKAAALQWIPTMLPFVMGGVVLWLAGRPLRAIGRRWRGEPTTVTIDAGTLSLGSEVVSGLRSGMVETLGLVHQVVLDTEREQLVIEVGSPDEGRALLEATGLAHKPVRLDVAPVASLGLRVMTAFVAFAAFFGGVTALRAWFRDHGMSLMLGSAWVMFLLAFRFLLVPTVTIGRDGLTVRRAFARTRFVPFAGLFARNVGRDLRFEAGKVRLRLPTTSALEAASILAHIEAARARFAERGSLRASLLARGGRSAAEWRTALANLQGYRGLSREDLVSVAEDPSASADERVGATLALCGDEQVRTRVAVAIATTVEPKLRVALEQASRGELEDEVLDAAMRR